MIGRYVPESLRHAMYEPLLPTDIDEMQRSLKIVVVMLVCMGSVAAIFIGVNYIRNGGMDQNNFKLIIEQNNM